MAKTDVAPSTADAVDLYTPGSASWDELIGQADTVTGHEMIKGDAADRLIGVPFVITRVVFREGTQRKGVLYRDDYVSCEAVVAPKEVLSERARRGRLNLDEISVDPDEHIVFNDGSTGIYRQIVSYLAAKDYIALGDDLPMEGGKGESRFDLPRGQWLRGWDEGTAGINIRLFCPRGLRYSEYDSEYTANGELAKTRYIG